MEPRPEAQAGLFSPAIELLGCTPATPTQDRSAPWPPARRRQLAAVVAVVVLLIVGSAWLPALRGDGAVIQPADTTFGDPFAMTWIALEGGGDPATDYLRPPPMASPKTFCMGFGRLDWAAADRSPSVAHCVSSASVDELGPNELTVVRESIAGDDTWIFLLFGGELDTIEAEVDGAPTLASPKVFHFGPFAALLVPNGYERLQLRWELTDGGGHRCTVPPGSLAQQRCR